MENPKPKTGDRSEEILKTFERLKLSSDTERQQFAGNGASSQDDRSDFVITRLSNSATG